MKEARRGGYKSGKEVWVSCAQKRAGLPAARQGTGGGGGDTTAEAEGDRQVRTRTHVHTPLRLPPPQDRSSLPRLGLSLTPTTAPSPHLPRAAPCAPLPQAFFAQIYSEAQSSRTAPGHVAIADLHAAGRLQRHYTMNIDGLCQVVGMDVWHWEFNPEGSTVEMHGNIRQLVCPGCGGVQQLCRAAVNAMKGGEAVRCPSCGQADLRFKVMLYDDGEGDCIMTDDVWERLEDDLGVRAAGGGRGKRKRDERGRQLVWEHAVW